jgi:oxygen-independent coproporphyrinogen-3 oxidase
MTLPRSLYLHIPFCRHRCAYCDFNTYAGKEASIPAYVEALCREVAVVARSAPARLAVETIFFGGGTPSLLAPERLGRVLDVIRAETDLAEEAEVSLEANPGTVSRQGMQGLRRAGFNRISLGVQSSHAEELRQLERIHDFPDVIRAVAWARTAGFGNLNLDLIFGLPEQTLPRWQTTLQRAVDLQPEHLSLYALTIEHGTLFGHWLRRGLLPVPDADLAAEMYEWAGEYLESCGYRQYEISNWSRPGEECRHNLTYWHNLPYLGFGAGAHGSVADFRVANILRIQSYLERMEARAAEVLFPFSPAAVNRQHIAPRVAMQETMMLGLRLTREGVARSAFRQRFDREMSDEFSTEIAELTRLGLLEWADEDRLRLTVRGRLLGNQAFLRFVDG